VRVQRNCPKVNRLRSKIGGYCFLFPGDLYEITETMRWSFFLHLLSMARFRWRVAGMVSCCVGSGSTAYAQTTQIRSFHSYRCQPAFGVTAAVDTVQRASHRGLVFTLVFRNPSAHRLTLGPPLEYLSADLFDAAGANLTAPSGLNPVVDTKGPRPVFKPYAVEDVTLNGQRSNTAWLDSASLVLPAHATLAVRLRLHSIAAAGAVPPYRQENARSIPAGDYQLLLTVLFATGDPRCFMQCDLVPIHYQK
jgi:hypothetical protein